MGKGIVLCSGGLDSTLALIRSAEDDKIKVFPLFINYNQYANRKEWRALIRVCNHLGITPPICIDLNLNIMGHKDTQVGSVWNRTMALVGIASMWAYINGNDYEYIAVGSHLGDVGPDIKPGEYDAYLDHTLRMGTKDQIRLELPIRDLTNEDVGIALGKTGIPFESMYSCYWDPPCGFKSTSEHYRCPGCRRKTIAMKAAGIDNEILLDYPNGNYGEITYQSPLAEKVNY